MNNTIKYLIGIILLLMVIGLLSGIDLYVVFFSIITGFIAYGIILFSSYVFGIIPGSEIFFRKYKYILKIMVGFISTVLVLGLIIVWSIRLIGLIYPSLVSVNDMNIYYFCSLTIGIIVGMINVYVIKSNHVMSFPYGMLL